MYENSPRTSFNKDRRGQKRYLYINIRNKFCLSDINFKYLRLLQDFFFFFAFQTCETTFIAAIRITVATVFCFLSQFTAPLSMRLRASSQAASWPSGSESTHKPGSQFVKQITQYSSWTTLKMEAVVSPESLELTQRITLHHVPKYCKSSGIAIMSCFQQAAFPSRLTLLQTLRIIDAGKKKTTSWRTVTVCKRR